MYTDSDNINFLRMLTKNIKKPTNRVLQKIYNKAKNSTSYKFTHKQLSRAQVRATRRESIHAAILLRKKLGLDPRKRSFVINLTKNNEIINLR